MQQVGDQYAATTSRRPDRAHMRIPHFFKKALRHQSSALRKPLAQAIPFIGAKTTKRVGDARRARCFGCDAALARRTQRVIASDHDGTKQ